MSQNKKAGRPKVVIDWEIVGKMLEAGGSAEGIAATLGIQRDTLYKRCKPDNKIDFSTLSQQKRAKGDELLKAKQFQVAMSGDKTMLIWLGKQRLGQTEAVRHSGPDGEPLQTNAGPVVVLYLPDNGRGDADQKAVDLIAPPAALTAGDPDEHIN